MRRLITLFSSVAIVLGLGACCCPCGPMMGGNRPPNQIVFNPPVINVPQPDGNINKPPDKKNPPPRDPAEEKVKKLNATITRDEAQPDRPVVEVKFEFPAGWQDSDLKNLAAFPQLRKLDLGQNQNAKGTGFKDLSGLQNLEYLDASAVSISDEGLKHIAALKQLKTLKFAGGAATFTGTTEIAKLDQLEELVASGIRNDQAIKEFANLNNLRRLQLDNSDFGDESAKAFTALSQLKILHVYGTKVTDEGLAELAKLKQLEELKIGYRITDIGVNALAGNNNLQVLSVWNSSGVTDASVPILMTLKGLRELDIGNTRITPKGQNQLRKAFGPKVKLNTK